MSVYQYVGQNLRTGLEVEGPFTASNVSFTGESDITSFGSTAQSMISGSFTGELSGSGIKFVGGGVSVVGVVTIANDIVLGGNLQTIGGGGAIVSSGGTFGNIQIGVTNDNTIDTKPK